MDIQMSKVTHNFGGVPLFKKIDFQLLSSEKIGLVGMNGTGKTTFFQLLTGQLQPDSGVVSRKKGLTIGYIEQNHQKIEESVLSYILSSFKELVELKQQLTKLALELTLDSSASTSLLEKYGRVQDKFELAGGYTLEDEVIGMLKGLGISDKINQSCEALSGGQRVRVELAKALVTKADVLLLDEPTNHLDIAGIQWLESYLKNTKKAYIVISHDRAFLDHVVSKIIEIEDSQLTSYKGNYSIYQKMKQEQIEQLKKDYALQQKEIMRLRRMAKQFRQWGNEGDNEKFFKKAKEIERRIEKIEQIKPPIKINKRMNKQIKESKKISKEVVVAKNIGKIIGDQLLFSDSTFKIFRHEKVALLGENGTGKTTLLNILLGKSLLDEGEIKVASSTRIGYLPQTITFEKPERRMIEYAKSVLNHEQQARAELARFGFFAEDVKKRLKDLSGGEQIRLYLLALFQEEINLLILDEPTNHLDIYAREEIEQILSEYQGTLLAVTHDRYFLSKAFQQSLVISDQKIIKHTQVIFD